MNTLQMSEEQLVGLVKSLEEAENTQFPDHLVQDFDLISDGKDELLKRVAAFENGELSTRPWNDIKKDFGLL